MTEEYLAGYLAWRPQTGTGLGLHQYDGKLTDYSKTSLEAELGRLQAFERRLASFDTNGLSKTSSCDYRFLQASVQRELFSFERMRVYWQNPMTYAGAADVSIYIKRDFAPLQERARSVISILDQVPGVMAAARDNLGDSLSRPLIETAIEEANGSADFLAKDLVVGLKDLGNPDLNNAFQAANKRAIDGLHQYAAWLKDEKLPKANDKFALGRENYIRLIQSGEMLSLTPERLLELGTAELKRQQKAFTEAAALIDPSMPAIEVFKSIQKAHPTEQSLIPDTRKNMEMIRRFLIDRRIVTLPSRVRATVAETPQFMRATSFASMDTPGPFEKKATEAYYYVTPVEPNWPENQKEEWLTAFNYFTTDIVSIHEAYPGHYVQFLCLNASPVSKLEKILGSYAFIEGWAHYSEQMMLDEGFGAGSGDQFKAAKYRLAQADEALLRCCRLCVSIKMHCQGMSVEEATKFFQENCYYEQKPAQQEAVRGTFDPEYLYYTIGKLEILKLRTDYQRQEGSRYSLREFHNELLRHGAPPIRLLREQMLKDPAQWADVL